MGAATDTGPHTETDPQRQALLAAADRLLAGTPTRSTGNLSVVQLAVEADVKYWVVAQKHSDLRDHFQRLATNARNAPATLGDTPSTHDQLVSDHAALKKHCAGLEELVTVYATAINELALENEILREQHVGARATVTPLRRRTDGSE